MFAQVSIVLVSKIAETMIPVKRNSIVYGESLNPTGNTEVPILVQRALEIKETISKSEVIGHARLNDTDNEK